MTRYIVGGHWQGRRCCHTDAPELHEHFASTSLDCLRLTPRVQRRGQNHHRPLPEARSSKRPLSPRPPATRGSATALLTPWERLYWRVPDRYRRRTPESLTLR